MTAGLVFASRSGRRHHLFFSSSCCGLPLQPDKCLRPRRAKEFRPRMRDAFVSPLRYRTRCDAAKISDLPSPAQRVNDCACVHVRHHRTCAAHPQGFFVLTNNACIPFFSALKLSHRSTEHRCDRWANRPRPDFRRRARRFRAASAIAGQNCDPVNPSRGVCRGNARVRHRQANRVDGKEQTEAPLFKSSAVTVRSAGSTRRQL